VFEGWRHATPDRLPLIGALPDEADIRSDPRAFARNDRLALPTLPGLYMHAALGARGLVWSMLGAELLADLAEGCAPPIESDLIRALAPERFLRQALRRARLR
jgi:tRNA 5-methylaminomethyl-2-thiouridine biosynthesis bifunctional protein